MSKQSRFSFFFVLVMVIIGSLTTVIETGAIAEPDLILFLCLRVPLLVAGLMAAFVFRRNPYSPRGHFFFGAILVLYVMHGQWYRPFYEYTFFQAMVFYTLLLYPPKRVFLTVLSVGSVLFIAVYHYRFDDVVLNSKTTLIENYPGIIAFMLTVYGVFKVFAEERGFREQALARFGLLGKHSAAILHDLKSTVGIPQIYTELTERSLAKGDIDKAREYMRKCNASIDSMQSVIVQLNQMSQLTQFNVEPIDLREIIEDVREVLRPKLKNVQLEVHGDAQIEVNRSFAFSFLLNLIMNSIENFASRNIQTPRIAIKLSSQGLLFEDNGGGFSANILKKIEAGAQASSKAQESGLGLFLLRDGLRNQGGRVAFGNSKDGVAIDIHF
ncbi:MAG: HAMP domain-containing histidine kinase [Bdellovibrionales bacterium]|nr:HAMP domain-containing histidine kinase [Bdellovibrionales bacterium]